MRTGKLGQMKRREATRYVLAVDMVLKTFLMRIFKEGQVKIRKIEIVPPNKDLVEIVHEIVKQNSKILEINSLLLQELLPDKSVVNLKVDTTNLKENKDENHFL